LAQTHQHAALLNVLVCRIGTLERPAAEQVDHVGARNDLLLEQQVGDLLQLILALRQEVDGALVRRLDDVADLIVDLLASGL
jgi:hypothetical protein